MPSGRQRPAWLLVLIVLVVVLLGVAMCLNRVGNRPGGWRLRPGGAAPAATPNPQPLPSPLSGPKR